MKPTYFHVSSSITLLLSLLLDINSILAVESSTSSNTTIIDDYIKKCCNLTHYQPLCYSSLSGQYSGPTDLGGLTCAAIKVSFIEATAVSDYMTSVNWTTDTNQVGPAVQDCTKLTKSTVGQVRQSFNLMVEVVDAYVAIGGAYNETEKRKMRFDFSSVQTWMSAGITNLDTCMEGFKDIGVKNDDQVESQVCGKVGVVIMLISNALALVNSYVDALK